MLVGQVFVVKRYWYFFGGCFLVSFKGVEQFGRYRVEVFWLERVGLGLFMGLFILYDVEQFFFYVGFLLFSIFL